VPFGIPLPAPKRSEKFFGELVDLGGIMKVEQQRLAELCGRYGLEMDPDSIPRLVERFGLRFPGEPVERTA
jgi:hypothetical protein